MFPVDSRGNSRSGEAEKKSVVGHQGLIPFKVVVVLTYVSGCKRNWVARWRGKFAELFSTLSLSKRYNHLDERTLLQHGPREVLRFMVNQGHHVKAGIEAVTPVCLVNHNSQYFCWSTFWAMTATFHVSVEREFPLELCHV